MHLEGQRGGRGRLCPPWGNNLRAPLLDPSPEITFNISIPDEGGDSILHFVLRTPNTRFGTSKTEIVELLKEHGADLFQPDRLGDTALHILASMPGEEDVQILRQILFGSGPVPYLNNQNHYGDTALTVAVQCNHLQAASLLLAVGADPNIKGEDESTAAQYAFQLGHMEMLALLWNSGAEIGGEVGLDYE